MSEGFETLTSGQLLQRVRELVRRGNAVEAELLAHLGEVDARKLYLEEGCSSMFTYCQRVLHFAEGVAYKRIQAARAVRRHPRVLDALRAGELHLTAVGLLAPKLTDDNCLELISAARHLGTDEIKRVLADREPRPAVAACIRRIAEPKRTAEQVAPPIQRSPAPPAAIELPVASLLLPPPRLDPKTEPLGAERFRVQFTADRETHAQLEELRALMRHQIPDGDVGKILSKAVSTLLEKVRKQKFGDTSKPSKAVAGKAASPASRHIPAAIRRAVWQRDAGRCTYVSASGRRCNAKEFIEFDHTEAWVWNRSHSIHGITLRCRAHNQYRAQQAFGRKHMARFGRTGFESSPAPPPERTDLG